MKTAWTSQGSETVRFHQGMFVQETHKCEGSEAVPIAAQLALLSRAYLEQGIFLANIIVLMHNHHNLQRGRLHMYSQNDLGQQTNQKINPAATVISSGSVQ